MKICGITSEEDALLAVAMGADAVGFVFAPSPRQMAAGAVAQITRRLPPEVVTVGVFRDELPERVVEIVNQAGLERRAAARPRDARGLLATSRGASPLSSRRSLSATRPSTRSASTAPMRCSSTRPRPVRARSSTGAWPRASRRARRLILAGGLAAENVADAISRVHPWGVDVRTGVEASPGEKDPRKVRAFVQAARAAAPEEYEPGADGPYDWQEEL